ncbi:glycosyltransferase family 4 protein [Thalassospira australica]|uniref:glycosyltransferase family 4 protein n=1 Tax=Thalassospira australica TaxID=1528106 RepID=UPI00384E5A45
MARLLCDALSYAGHDIDIASRLRSRVGYGNVLRQSQIAELASKLTARLLRQYQNGTRKRPDIWFTYHLYYKAPDWIGPIIANALDIPYVVAEASYAPKRAKGPWAQSHAAVEYALRRADAVFSLNRADMKCLVPLCGQDRLHYLPPFTHTENWHAADRGMLDPDLPVQLVTTAMMRPGDKLQSYELLAKALGKLNTRNIKNWHLTVIGDGPARAEVENAFARNAIADDQLDFAGLCDTDRTRILLARSDMFVWPAINEAYGMALLEAQAAALPVLVGDCGGVSGIVENGETGWLVPVGDIDAFANRLAECLGSRCNELRRTGHAASQKAERIHTLSAAAEMLGASLHRVVENYKIRSRDV